MSSLQSQSVSECMSSSSSSSTSSSPSMCLGSNETPNPLTTHHMIATNIPILPLTKSLRTTSRTTDDNNQHMIGAQELSKLYAIRSECYLTLGLHQLAFDDCVNGSQLDPKNPNLYRLKGRALLGLNRKESAEHSFQMSIELSKKYSQPSDESVISRYNALKEAGFDHQTANMFAPKSRSVNDAIDNILNTSLTSGQLSSLRDSYTRSLNTNDSGNQLPPQCLDTTMSAMFGNMNETNNSGNRANGASQALGLKLISDIDNCLGSILDSDGEKTHIFDEKNDNNIISATNCSDFSNMNINNNSINKSNNNYCDIGDNGYQSRSLSPQTKQSLFGISSDHQLMQKGNNFTIDLNKDSLGSQILPKTLKNNNRSAGSGGQSTRKTFADIASANAKKSVQTMKTTAKTNTMKDTDTRDTPVSRSQTPSDAGTKLSALESFGAPNYATESVDKIEKFGEIVVLEPIKPTNLMAYKGLWVCNISPDASYITLKKVFRKYGNFTGIQTFERKATNGSNIVFVHYDNSQSPTDAIAELFGVYRKDICFDEKTLLKLRFTPSMEQTKNGDMPSMEKARRVVEKSGECFNWRLSTGCHKGDRCSYKHIPINKAVDSQPWVKALKKKANDA
ncbi:unnamed protein product [Medioppia subpectinata]|uniref:Uncharacterized protein n=1 Tax=Medioppia subpectinata TaxID=1979941 RepID=A0A7R9Q1Y5_9ACAR|nr:unnamed protein product [Medioppia subpectinata]CAG2109568.1 unnamed protein product [Medioppia subpectinata]